MTTAKTPRTPSSRQENVLSAGRRSQRFSFVNCSANAEPAHRKSGLSEPAWTVESNRQEKPNLGALGVLAVEWVIMKHSSVGSKAWGSAADGRIPNCSSTRNNSGQSSVAPRRHASKQHFFSAGRTSRRPASRAALEWRYQHHHVNTCSRPDRRGGSSLTTPWATEAAALRIPRAEHEAPRLPCARE